MGQNLTSETFLVNKAQKEARNNHKAVTLWLTGLSASGKSTLAKTLEAELFKRNVHTAILDGDNIRQGLNKDTDFTDAGRSENIRRVAEVAKLMNDAGLLVIAAFISPFEKDRAIAKQIIGQNVFVEVYVKASLACCESRDPKGLYQKSREGIIKNFTGIDSDYQAPENASVVVETDKQNIASCVAIIIAFLSRKQLI